MKTRAQWVIYGQQGKSITKLREGSVRFGRTMRAAKAIAQYTQASVFITRSDPSDLSGRFYTSATYSVS